MKFEKAPWANRCIFKFSNHIEGHYFILSLPEDFMSQLVQNRDGEDDFYILISIKYLD